MTAPLNTVSNMKSIILASTFLIEWHVLHINLCEVVTRSGKELNMIENKIVKDNFETTHLIKVILKFRRKSFQKKLRYVYVQVKLNELVFSMMIFTVIILGEHLFQNFGSEIPETSWVRGHIQLET